MGRSTVSMVLMVARGPAYRTMDRPSRIDPDIVRTNTMVQPSRADAIEFALQTPRALGVERPNGSAISTDRGSLTSTRAIAYVDDTALDNVPGKLSAACGQPDPRQIMIGASARGGGPIPRSLRPAPHSRAR